MIIDGRPIHYYLLDEQNQPYPTEDHFAAQRLLADVDRRQVTRDEWTIEAVSIVLSTVFTVLDQSLFETAQPLLYQTALYGDGVELFVDRKRTKLGAAEVHARVKRRVLPFIETQDLVGFLATGFYGDVDDQQQPTIVDSTAIVIDDTVKLLPTVERFL